MPPSLTTRRLLLSLRAFGKSWSKGRVCYWCGKSGHYIAKCPYASDSDRDNDNKGKKEMEKKKYYHKMGGETHMGK
jgi:hypothetical protein